MHKTTDGRSIPVLYCGMEIGGSDRVMTFGRDLSAASTLQQRLLNAQQSVVRDYARLRDTEESGCATPRSVTACCPSNRRKRS